jgi:hypothetical protein
MSAGTDALKVAFRDFNTLGVPASGPSDPHKPELRAAIDRVGLDIAAAAVAVSGDGIEAVVAAIQPLVDEALAATAEGQEAATQAQTAAASVQAVSANLSAIALGGTGKGLLYKSDGTLTGWTGDTASWTSVTKPALISYNPSAVIAQAPGAAGTSDHGGVREGYWFQDTDGTWYIFYGAGNGSTTDAGGPWRPQYAKSTNKGLSWTKLGEVPGISLNHGYDGGKWAARDNLFVFKHTDGFYYFNTLTAATVGDNQVCGQPYTSDVWKAATINGPYTYVGATLTQGPAGRFDAFDAYASCLVPPQSTGDVWRLFYSATRTAAAEWYIGLATATTPYGPFTSTGTQVLPDSIRGQDENPEVYWHPVLAKWVMTTNIINKTLGGTDSNRVYFSDSLTDWSAATAHVTQRISPMDGATAIGHSRPKRIAGYALDMDGQGNVPLIFDTDPTPGVFGNHTGRRLKYAWLEPSTRELAITAGAGTGTPILRPVAHSSFVADFVVRASALTGTLNFFYRLQDAAGIQNGYMLTFDVGRTTALAYTSAISKIVNGVTTQLNVSGPNAAVRSVAGLYHRVTIEIQGQRHVVRVDGEKQIDFADTTFGAGLAMGFRANGSANLAVRGFTARESNKVTVNGVSPGQVITLRGPGYIPLASGVATGTEITLTAAHYPASSIDADGVNIYAPAAGVWGGEVIG